MLWYEDWINKLQMLCGGVIISTNKNVVHHHLSTTSSTKPILINPPSTTTYRRRRWRCISSKITHLKQPRQQEDPIDESPSPLLQLAAAGGGGGGGNSAILSACFVGLFTGITVVLFNYTVCNITFQSYLYLFLCPK